jgi:hypothetical protein
MRKMILVDKPKPKKKKLLDSYALRRKIIVYVKDEGFEHYDCSLKINCKL